MNKGLRFFILIIVMGVGLFFLWPTLNWYFFISDDEKVLLSDTQSEFKQAIETRINQDINRLISLAREDEQALIPDELRYVEKLAQRGIDKAEQWGVGQVLLSFGGENREEAVENILREMRTYFQNKYTPLRNEKNRIIQLGLDLSGGVNILLEGKVDSLAKKLGYKPQEQEVSDAMDAAIEVLSTRVNQFGVSQPQIRRISGQERILLDIPGNPDPDMVQSFTRESGNLRFQIVDDEVTQKLMKDYEAALWHEGDLNPPYIPVNAVIMPHVKKDTYGIDEVVNYVVLMNDDENILDGKYVRDVGTTQSDLQQPLVSFQMTSDGAKKLQELTKQNVGKTMAIVLDGKVKASARISQEIAGGSAQIQGFDLSEAYNIATVLRTASLPIQLEILSQQRIGSSLGQQAIESGLMAISIGLLFVILFMIMYYRASGVIAAFALLLNLFLLLSILSAFNLTLTLTGIAGIILTVGMAVDANVIIFERIKEEMREGKTVANSVYTGFKKAFVTVLDANLTTLIAALVLSYLATGTIQGFAVMLSVGIVTSMFSALFITKLFMMSVISCSRSQKISISWRKI